MTNQHDIDRPKSGRPDVARVVSLWRYDPDSDAPPQGRLRRMLQYWIRFGEVLGTVVGTVVLSLIYVIFLGPVRLYWLVRGRDPLRQRSGQPVSMWDDRDGTAPDREHAKRQF